MKQPCTLLRTARTAISPQDRLRSGTPTAHERVALPLLPSGPGGVRRFPLRGAQPSTPPHEAHSTRTALEREFNPAEADCGLQGTANSPSSTATLQTTAIRAGSPGKCEKVAEGVGFEPTAQGLAPCTAFPVPHLRPLGHPSGYSRGERGAAPPDTPHRSERHPSGRLRFLPPETILGTGAKPPFGIVIKQLRCSYGEEWRRGEDLNPRGTFWAPIRFRVGRLQPGSATPPRQPNQRTNRPPVYLSRHARSLRRSIPALSPPAPAARF